MTNEDKVGIYGKFSDSVYRKFRELRYGITSCCDHKSLEEYEMSKDLCDWKQLKGSQDLSDTQIRYFANMPIFVDGQTGEFSNDSHYRYAGSASNRSATVTYEYASDGNVNIIEVNSGGAVTRINLNPVINIDRRAPSEFTFEQLTPLAVWVITHNLGFVPGNELITDLNGNEIDGITRPINDNTIEITFSEPVAGYAYLS
jgi:hypothetical protein